MWWRDVIALPRRGRHLAGVVLSLALVAGCGFRPLYAPSALTTTDPRLAAIQVPQIPERIGQRLTISLRDGFNPSGATVDPLYRLQVTLTTTRRETALRTDGTATRAEISVAASYNLIDLKNGRSAMSGTAQSGSSVDLVVNEYSNVVAEDDARTRAVEEIAFELQTRCAMFLERPTAAAK
jgi:LPS-assembly lipoprotein